MFLNGKHLTEEHKNSIVLKIFNNHNLQVVD
jgi:hypothetical protein